MRDTSERRLQIITMVREHGSVQVVSLAERFRVSLQTIRKDLDFLVRRGVAERSYGGAIAADAVNVTVEPGVETKRASRTDEKTRIGRLAADLVGSGESIVIDSGTTTLQLARALADDEDVTVLTNDLDILGALAAKKHLNVVMLGGALRRKNRAFYGAQTLAALDDLSVDTLFLGVDGLDPECGVTTHYEPEAMLNRKMVAAARRVVAVTDSSKLGRVCLHRIVPLDAIDDLVTDAGAPDTLRDAARRFGFRLHLA